MIFVDTIRKYQEYVEFDAAMELAVNECIKNGILADFLKRNKAEVLRMSIFEYDQEEHLRMEREESEAIGREIGIEIGRKEGREEQAREMSIEYAQLGFPLDKIAKVAKVSIDVVKQWLSAEGISVNQ